MYDAVAEAVPLAQRGQNRKKALVVISDGNDTGSRADIREVKQLIRESEVLVYAVGIDGEGEPTTCGGRRRRRAAPLPMPFPFPGGGGRGGRRRLSPIPGRGGAAAAGRAAATTIASTSPRCAT